MTVRVLLFGPEAAAAGRAYIAVEAEAGATGADLKSRLAEACPALRPLLPAGRLAVNHEFVPDCRGVLPGDEVALLGLVSGG